MRLDDERESSNVEDRRGGMPGGRAGGIGLGTIALALVAMYFGVDPSTVLNIGQQMQQPTEVEAKAIPQDDPMAKFVAKVLREYRRYLGKSISRSRATIPSPKIGAF